MLVILCISVVSDPLLVLILCSGSLFFLISLSKDLPILFVFAKNQLFLLLVFWSILYLFLKRFCCDIYVFLSFYKLQIFSFLVSLDLSLLFILYFSYFLRWSFIIINYPLRIYICIYNKYICI